VNEFNTLIIGAGPAGLFTAIHLNTGPVNILERNELPGRKLMIAGSGRCNITHAGDISAFFTHYGENSRFLRTALYEFTNDDLVDFFAGRGLHSITDKNGKVFPYSEKSSDVLNVLLAECRARKVRIQSGDKVMDVHNKGGTFIVKTTSSIYKSKQLVIATGGLSYPSTGSTGDGYSFAKELGHTIVTPKPSLSPVFIRSYSMKELAGVSLQNKTICLYRENKKIEEHSGDIGFTHHGLTGPGILDFSRFMNENDELRINFLDIKPESFRQLVIEASEKTGKMAVLTFLRSFEIPRSLVKIILDELKISHELAMARLEKEQRVKLIRAFCEYPFVIESVGGFKMAMVTHGGISIKEVSPKTMESRLVPGLYFAGEVLDIDGDTGGYNLQAAFSSGYLVAKSINESKVG
jgi:predicted Rossmann fold flavoprotein